MTKDEIFIKYYNENYPCLNGNENENKYIRQKRNMTIENLSSEEKDMLLNSLHFQSYLLTLSINEFEQNLKRSLHFIYPILEYCLKHIWIYVLLNIIATIFIGISLYRTFFN